jgi:hypothetical protein
MSALSQSHWVVALPMVWLKNGNWFVKAAQKNRHLGWGVVGLDGEHDAGESLEGCGECWQKSGRRLTSV